MAQINLDEYSVAETHAIKQKRTFDRQVEDSRLGEQVFERVDLVQVYRNNLKNTFAAV
jgi:hypothetical protein